MLWDGSEEGMGIIPSKKRWERKQKARDRSVKFQGGKSPTQENKSAADVNKHFTIIYINWNI